MKNHLYILIALLALASMASAQPKLQHEEIYLGVQGGAVASMVQFSPVVAQDPFKSYLGYTGGLVFRYIGHKSCGLQVEANWLQRGWCEWTTADTRSEQYQRRLDYIEVPFLTHICFGRRVRGFINLGPQLGFLVHESATGNQPDERPQYAPVDKRFDWGVAGGLGLYGRSAKAGTFQLEARFNYSLGTLFSNSQMDYFRNSNSMNLALTFAYLWQLKGDK